MRARHDPSIPRHDITMRLVITRRVSGRMTPDKRHRVVKAIRRLLANAGAGYTVALAEVISTTPAR